jgi:hypothetical protein
MSRPVAISKRGKPLITGPLPWPGHDALAAMDLDQWRWHDGERWWDAYQLDAYFRKHGRWPSERGKPVLAK